ncbi:MAG: hypothetical protein K9W44_06690 [Candidatus Lokiarchaeota archaeon]|nr:hypothetical protein [Candidatus Harpocratesius repetitus]
MVNEIAIIGEIIGYVTAFIIAAVIMRKKPSYIGNRYFAASFILFGTYSLVMMIYEFGISEIVVLVLFYLSLVILNYATAFFVISMQIFIYSKSWLESKIPKVVLAGSTIIAIISVVMPVKVESLGPVQTTKNLVALISMGIWQYTLLIYSLVKISQVLKNIEQTNNLVKKKIQKLWIAQLIGLMAPTASVIGNILQNYVIVALLHIFLASAFILVALAILGKKDIE